MKELLGGEERIDEACSTWGDSFIVNLGTPALAEQKTPLPPQELDNWHVDGDFFVHYVDSPEQALLVIPNSRILVYDSLYNWRGRLQFWSGVIERAFPRLNKRRLLKLTSSRLILVY